MTKIFGKITTGFLRAIFVLSRARIRNCHGQFCYVTGKNPVIVTATFRFPRAFFFAILSRETRQFSLENFGVLCHGQFFKTTAHFQKVSRADRRVKNTLISARRGKLFYRIAVKTAKRQNGNDFWRVLGLMISASQQGTAKVLPNCRFCVISTRRDKLFYRIAAKNSKTAKRHPFFRHIGKARQTVLPYCRKNGKTAIFFKSMKAHDISNLVGHGKGSAALPFLRHIGKVLQAVLPYCRKNGKTATFF